jgi:conjugal transfer pilus assembly protein TraK
MNKKLLSFAIAGAMTLATGQAVSVELPTIPVKVVKQAEKEAKDAIKNGTPIVESSSSGIATTTNKPSKRMSNAKRPEQLPLDIQIKPGTNEIVTVSKGLMNRIVVPFPTPEVHTVNDSVIKVKNNIIYVATQTKSPIGLFITDKDDQSIAISMTLVPRDIPPREIRLKLNRGISTWSGNPMARKWEESGDYTSQVKKLLRSIALQEKPPGYSLTKLSREDQARFACQIPGLDLAISQSIEGHHFRVGILTAVNTSKETIEINEPDCHRDGVVAVAAWPTVVLRPGEASELYIVRRNETMDALPYRQSSVIGSN